MSDVAIKIENIGKKYKLGQRGPAYTTLRESISAMFNKKRKSAGQIESELWALNNINLEIKRGEVVGVIGRNGAGKSTLLKILSRITEPTTGKIELNGRVGSLLEVGTGFHPELTGRENIFLNGSIIGMRKAEIEAKFAQIVSFSEIEKFIDTPVKHYSSGMYVRLAFAVAAHLEPEILLVDEVLAVGDAKFQEKCLGKMQEVAGRGRTVLFVSHNMAMIKSLCTKGVYLDRGQIHDSGSIDNVIAEYISGKDDSSSTNLQEVSTRNGNATALFKSFHFQVSGKTVSTVLSGDKVDLVLTFDCKDKVLEGNLVFSVGVSDLYGRNVMLFRSNYTGDDFRSLKTDEVVVCTINKFPLTTGKYFLSFYLENNGEVVDWISGQNSFQVENGDFFGTGQVIHKGFSSFFVDHSWSKK